MNRQLAPITLLVLLALAAASPAAAASRPLHRQACPLSRADVQRRPPPRLPLPSAALIEPPAERPQRRTWLIVVGAGALGAALLTTAR